MLAFVLLHLLVALGLPFLARRSTRAAFLTAAVPPAAALVWVLAQAGPVLSGQVRSETVAWAPLIAAEGGRRRVGPLGQPTGRQARRGQSAGTRAASGPITPRARSGRLSRSATSLIIRWSPASERPPRRARPSRSTK